jgi:hypothetical protein
MAKIDWTRHIAAWQVSGLSQAAYCRLHGLNASYFWKKLQADRTLLPSGRQALIPVRVEPPVGGAGMALCTRQGHRLELPETVSPRWLAELLQCLG